MEKDIQESVIAYLENDNDYLVPLKKIWETQKPENVSWDAFIDAVKKDDRIYFQEGTDMFADMDLGEKEKLEEEKVMAQLGYFSGPRVALKSKLPTSEEIFKQIAQQLKTMQDALANAYVHRPQNDQQAEEKLLEAMDKAKDLEERLIKTFQAAKEQN